MPERLITYKNRHKLPDKNVVAVFDHMRRTGGMTITRAVQVMLHQMPGQRFCRAARREEGATRAVVTDEQRSRTAKAQAGIDATLLEPL